MLTQLNKNDKNVQDKNDTPRELSPLLVPIPVRTEDTVERQAQLYYY